MLTLLCSPQYLKVIKLVDYLFEFTCIAPSNLTSNYLHPSLPLDLLRDILPWYGVCSCSPNTLHQVSLFDSGSLETITEFVALFPIASTLGLGEEALDHTLIPLAVVSSQLTIERRRLSRSLHKCTIRESNGELRKVRG